MRNLITKTSDFAMKIVSEYVKQGDITIDATAGNGHDSLMLCKMSGTGKLYAFDIQQRALQQTKSLLKEEGIDLQRVHFIWDCHGNMDLYVEEKERIAAIVFNLGYLPTGEKNITTEKITTIRGVAKALKLIRKGGIVSVTIYDGHESGRAEKKALLEFAGKLPSKKYHVVYVNYLNQYKNPPEILFLTKK